MLDEVFQNGLAQLLWPFFIGSSAHEPTVTYLKRSFQVWAETLPAARIRAATTIQVLRTASTWP